MSVPGACVAGREKPRGRGRAAAAGVGDDIKRRDQLHLVHDRGGGGALTVRMSAVVCGVQLPRRVLVQC